MLGQVELRESIRIIGKITIGGNSHCTIAESFQSVIEGYLQIFTGLGGADGWLEFPKASFLTCKFEEEVCPGDCHSVSQ